MGDGKKAGCVYILAFNAMSIPLIYIAILISQCMGETQLFQPNFRTWWWLAIPVAVILGLAVSAVQILPLIVFRGTVQNSLARQIICLSPTILVCAFLLMQWHLNNSLTVFEDRIMDPIPSTVTNVQARRFHAINKFAVAFRFECQPHDVDAIIAKDSFQPATAPEDLQAQAAAFPQQYVLRPLHMKNPTLYVAEEPPIRKQMLVDETRTQVYWVATKSPKP